MLRQTKNINRLPIPIRCMLTLSFKNINSVSAAMPSLQNTIVNGGKSTSDIFMKKNDPPHRTDNTINMLHSMPFIDVFCFIANP